MAITKFIDNPDCCCVEASENDCLACLDDTTPQSIWVVLSDPDPCCGCTECSSYVGTYELLQDPTLGDFCYYIYEDEDSYPCHPFGDATDPAGTFQINVRIQWDDPANTEVWLEDIDVLCDNDATHGLHTDNYPNQDLGAYQIDCLEDWGPVTIGSADSPIRGCNFQLSISPYEP